MKEIQEAIERAVNELYASGFIEEDKIPNVYSCIKPYWDESLSLVAEKQVVDDGIKEATQNALYATGKFSELQCEELSEGIFQYIKDHYKVFPLITETINT